MFTDNVYIGVPLAIGLIGCLIWLVLKYTRELEPDRKILVLLLVLVCGMMGVWIADKVVAFKIHLLSEKENDKIFDMLGYITVSVLTHYLSTKKKETQN